MFKECFAISIILVCFFMSCGSYPIKEVPQDDALEKELRADVDPFKEVSEKELRSLEDKKNSKKK